MGSLNDLFKQQYGSRLSELFNPPLAIIRFCRKIEDKDLEHYLMHKGMFSV